MLYFPLSALINALTSAGLGAFIFLQNPRSRKHSTYLVFCISVVVWSVAYFSWQVATSPEKALFYCRVLMAGAIFIPVLYLHHLLEFLDRTKSNKTFLFLCYAFAIMAEIANTT